MEPGNTLTAGDKAATGEPTEAADAAPAETIVTAATAAAEAARGAWILTRLPADLRARLDATDAAALCVAAAGGATGGAAWRRHPVDIRLSLPWVGRRFYVTVVSGPERRPKTRRVAEGAQRPLIAIGNILFAIGLTTVLFLGGALAVLFLTSLVEY